jgi:hypothetical protein
MNVRGDVLLLVTVAAMAAMPVAGQDLVPAVRQGLAPAVMAAGATQSAASVPDFSGMWAHPYNPGFELPVSGPGPVRRMTSRGRLIGDYTNPILKPRAAEAVKKHDDLELGGETAAIPSNQCWPSGVPYIFFQPGMQMVQQPDRITFLYLRDHEVRHVRMNEAHPARVAPSWYGDSVGHYEGDTLVIDTVGVRTDRPFAMIDMFGTPYTQALHVVERYRLIDYGDAKAVIDRNSTHNTRIAEVFVDPTYRGKHLQLSFTVEDEGVFMMPWFATITYARLLGAWEEHVCSENPHEYYNSKDSEVPVADKPDF